jgi:hypothetical protein
MKLKKRKTLLTYTLGPGLEFFNNFVYWTIGENFPKIQK